MTHRGPFQPLLFCDSVILYGKLSFLQNVCERLPKAVKVHGGRQRMKQSPRNAKLKD